MKNSLEERIDQLKLKNATQKMNIFGRLLVDNREMSIWEHDTKTLSWGVRRWRRKALKFAREYIRPLAPEADLHPHDYDPQPILSAAARQGFQTLLLVPPFGTASTLSYSDFLIPCSNQMAHPHGDQTNLYINLSPFSG